MTTNSFTVISQGRALEIVARYRSAAEDLLFFIHGLGCSHNSFADAWSYCAFRDLALLAVDLVGFGASVKGTDFSYAMEDHASICSKLLEQLAFKRLHIVAHSMGGAIGLLLSPRVIEKVVSFSNIEGNLTASDCGFSRRTIEVSFDEFQNKLLPKFKTEWGRYADLESASTLAFYRSAKSLVEWSDSGKLLEKFAQLTCRKKYFYGTKKPNYETIEALATIDSEIPNGIPDSGHFVMNDNPDAFYSSLGQFVRVV